MKRNTSRNLPACSTLLFLLALSSPSRLSACQGDLNRDGLRDLSDLATLLASYGTAGGAVYENGDLDGDGDVDLADLAALLSLYGAPCPDVGDMAFIPAGVFQMGDTLNEGYIDEYPLHNVSLAPLYIDLYEVTNQQYADALNRVYAQGGVIAVINGQVCQYGFGITRPFCDTTDTSTFSMIVWDGGTFSVRAGRETHPMVRVTWYGSVAYANWRSLDEGRSACYNPADWSCDFGADGYRLPTEAEWEKAARGGAAGHRFPWTDTDTIQHARADYFSSVHYDYDTSPTRGYHPEFSGGASPFTAPVGYFAPNGYGLYDMAGNVWEWCNDWYATAYYSSAPPTDPTGPSTGTFRVQRGGGWDTLAYVCRCADRFFNTPDYRSNYGGFRLVLPAR